MIPYIEIPPIKAGPVEIYAFGILVMIAILVANWVASKRAADFGFEKRDVQRAVLWVIVFGFIGAHLVDVFFYHPKRLLDDPLLILKLNIGLSSYGGFLGAFVGVFLYARRQAISFRAIMDPLCLGFVAGWPIGRMGCFLAHDHPGRYSEFFLAVAYPGGARHDLGLYEMLLAIVIFFLFERLRRLELSSGSLVLMVVLLYTPVRFLLDFLRIDDVRKLGLTPAQFASIIFFVVAAALFIRLKASSAKGAVNVKRSGKGRKN